MGRGVFPVITGLTFYLCILPVVEAIVSSVKVTFEKSQNKESGKREMQLQSIAAHVLAVYAG